MSGVRTALLEGGQILALVLDAPKGNVLSMARMAELSAALAEHRGNPSLKAVLWTAGGDHFSFGASVEEHQKAQAAGMLKAFHAFIRELVQYPVPVLVGVQGRCLGGAFETVLACSMVFASPTALFGCPEIRLGVFPPVLAVLGGHRLGVPLTERLLLSGGMLSCDEAMRAGLVAQRVEGDLHAALLAWAKENLLPSSAFSLRQAQRVLRRATGLWAAVETPLAEAEAHYLEALLPSHDGNEGISAFLEKRKPVWKDA